MVKSPKIYLRDSGLVHALLGIGDFGRLTGHPVVGASWEDIKPEKAFVLYGGWEHYPLNPDTEAVGLRTLCEILARSG